MQKKHILISCLVLFSLALIAQEENQEKLKYSPYELLSSYYNTDFKPFKKGAVYIGLSLSLEDRLQENTQGLFQNVIEGDRINFDILLKGGYYLSDYSMIGLNLNIFENKFEGTVFRDPDIIDSKSITRGVSFTPNFRTSIPLTSNERLSFFTTTGLTLGKSNTLTRETKNTDQIDKRFTTDYNFRLGISPGVTFFAMENFALEVQLDVLGYELNVKNATKNDFEESRDVRHNVDFNLNLLSVTIGLAYYL